MDLGRKQKEKKTDSIKGTDSESFHFQTKNSNLNRPKKILE